MRREFGRFSSTFGSEPYRSNLFSKERRFKFRQFASYFGHFFPACQRGKVSQKIPPQRCNFLYFFVFFWGLPGRSSLFCSFCAVMRGLFEARVKVAGRISLGEISHPITFCIFVNLGPKVMLKAELFYP